jgi:hypothetical protein
VRQAAVEYVHTYATISAVVERVEYVCPATPFEQALKDGVMMIPDDRGFFFFFFFFLFFLSPVTPSRFSMRFLNSCMYLQPLTNGVVYFSPPRPFGALFRNKPFPTS